MKVHGRTGRGRLGASGGQNRSPGGEILDRGAGGGKAQRAHVLAPLALAALTALVAGCGGGGKTVTRSADAANAQAAAAARGDTSGTPVVDASLSAKPLGPVATLPPNELGMIPVLEYHVIQEQVKGQFERTPEQFRHDLEELYARGYRPVNMQDVLDKKIQELPKGISPVVFTFDDASPSQFSFVGSPGKIDPNSAIGMWVDFQKKHPDWGSKAVFCMLPAAAAGHAFFGEKGIDGQQTAWRFIKVKWLADHGFQLCDHTLWHARLDKYPAAFDMQQIARGQMAIDSAVPGYRITAMALPLGMWPKDKSVAWQGSWTDPKTGKTISYHFQSVFEVSGAPNVNPYLPGFDPHFIHRQIMSGNALDATLNALEKPGPHSRYISDGNPATVARSGTVAQAGATAPAASAKP